MTARPELYAQLNQGLSLWHSGRPYPAHEFWEAAWKNLQGEERTVAQALVQLAAARVKRSDGNETGVQKLLSKAAENLTDVNRTALGLEPAGLLSDIRALSQNPGDAALSALLPRKVHEAGIVYLHGFASGPGSAKAKIIAGALSEDGRAVRVPNLNDGGFTGLTVTRALRQASGCLFDRTLVIGSSMGGYLATLLAHKDPRVCGLVLMAPAFDLAERLERRYDRNGQWRSKGQILVEHFALGGEQPIDYAFVPDAKAYPGQPTIPEPAYVITGTRDDVVPLALVKGVVETSAPSIEFEIVDDDHSLIASASKPLAAARRLASDILDR